MSDKQEAPPDVSHPPDEEPDEEPEDNVTPQNSDHSDHVSSENITFLHNNN